VGEEPGQHLQQHLVSEVEQFGDLAGQRLGRLRLRFFDVVGLLREGGPDRRHDVIDHREMQHLLDGDAGQGLLPSRDRVGLLRGQALTGLGPEAETRVQVLAHDHVLVLRCLDQQAPQMLAVLDHKPWLRHQRSRSAGAVPTEDPGL
jgi:hypothetical protein